jgi:hypothetical protein
VGTKVAAGSAVEGVVSTPILKRRRLSGKLVMVPGMVFLYLSGYRRSSDAIISFATEGDEEERRSTRSTST